jgi:hypothetical protein
MEDYKHDENRYIGFCRVIIGKILIVEESIKTIYYVGLSS